MTRRTLWLPITLTLGLLVAPLAAEASQGGKVYRIGVLERTSMALNAANLDAFRQGLREFGYVEGQNVVTEYCYTEGSNERWADLATELVRLKVDLILTGETPAVLAAKNATGTIPVVMAASGDPLGTGIVASLARPGRNVTGLSAFVRDLQAKRVELLSKMVPGIARVTDLFNLTEVTQER
jgi:putative ABC transport system substrate-binding protein